jgi:hypothetical protein
MKVQHRPGGFNDVSVWVDGRLLHVTAEGARVHCFLEDAEIWNWLAPETLLFCRQAVQGNLCLSVHQGQSGTGWLVGSGLVRDLGPTFGVQPVGIDAHEAYVVRSGAAYDRIGMVSHPYPSGAPGSSQGLSDVQPDGTLWWADLHRTMVVNGVTFTYPNQRWTENVGAVTVGQVDGGIMAAFAGKNTLVIPGAECYEPHVAVSPTGRVAICARTPLGAAYVATTIQELSA